MSIKKLTAMLLALSMSMAACGGGSSGGDGGLTSGGGMGGSSSSGDTQSDVGGTPNPDNDNPDQDSFNATLTSAPDDGALISDSVRLELEGYGIENAELLPAEGGRPYALFNVSEDKSRAWIEFDTRTVANGEVRVVIEAYDQPPRTAGASTIGAMQPRSWTVQNASISSPYPGVYPLRRDAGPLQARIDMSQAEFASMIDTEWPRVHALLQEYIPDNVVFEPPVPRGFEGPRRSCIQDAYASPEACREYMFRIVMLIQ
jgi:hypothetical protein